MGGDSVIFSGAEGQRVYRAMRTNASRGGFSADQQRCHRKLKTLFKSPHCGFTSRHPKGTIRFPPSPSCRRLRIPLTTFFLRITILPSPLRQTRKHQRCTREVPISSSRPIRFRGAGRGTCLTCTSTVDHGVALERVIFGLFFFSLPSFRNHRN